MLTYPLQSSKIAGDATVAQVIAFLKSPTLLARRLAEILYAEQGQSGIISPLLLTQRYTVQGGLLAFFQDETVFSGEAPETVTPGSSYPQVTLSEDQIKILAASKVGFSTWVTDEAVGRENIQPVDRALALLANTLILNFDTKSLAVIGSGVSAGYTGGSWTTGTSDVLSEQIVADVLGSVASITGVKKGFVADSVVLTELQYAKVLPRLLSILPREATNPVVAGGFPDILGLKWFHSPFLPSGWTPLVLDSTNLGGIAHESIPSPEYSSISTVVPNDASNIEVSRMRPGQDSTQITLRKSDVPLIRNPSAAVKITGTGL